MQRLPPILRRGQDATACLKIAEGHALLGGAQRRPFWQRAACAQAEWGGGVLPHYLTASVFHEELDSSLPWNGAGLPWRSSVGGLRSLALQACPPWRRSWAPLRRPSPGAWQPWSRQLRSSSSRWQPC